MSITSVTSQRLAGGSWRVTWASDLGTPTFYVYRDGSLVAVTQATSRTFTVPTGHSPVIEVFDSSSTSPSAVYPGQATVAWYRPSGAAQADIDHYRVEEYVSAAWTLRKKVVEDGAGFWRWTSRWLEDVTTHQFRVIAVHANGNQSTATQLDVFMVRHPSPPKVTLNYASGTGKVTVASA